MDPEKSIVDHLWFVLRNPNLTLSVFNIGDYGSRNKNLLDFGKLNYMLQSMFNSFEHQIHTTLLHTQCFNEDTLFSVLQAIKPGTLGSLSFEISWKEEGNYQKMEEIVQLEQWKQAKRICSLEVIPLTVNDVLHCKSFSLRLKEMTPEDLVRVRDDFLNSIDIDDCTLTIENAHIIFNRIGRAFESGNIKPRIAKKKWKKQIIYRYPLQNSENDLRVILQLDKNMIVFGRVNKNESLSKF